MSKSFWSRRQAEALERELVVKAVGAVGLPSPFISQDTGRGEIVGWAAVTDEQTAVGLSRARAKRSRTTVERSRSPVERSRTPVECGPATVRSSLTAGGVLRVRGWYGGVSSARRRDAQIAVVQACPAEREK